ncbi:MAG: rhodanese-like domain-containing protein, partial [Acidimicrobiaceae bacterium]|nr:rhodanese-like domain-containing protein [Acidimicrobiaceae bacterium]MYE65315.1 rhodanese-like domain-containing protein [Acidimicrobiaceae bacterium]
MTRRHEAVQSALDEIRRLRDTLGPSEELLEAVGPTLTELALREELFDADAFAVDAGALMTIYELSVDIDGRLGLYASAGMPGKQQPPHDHRTWSVIAGVRGAEHNQYFERTDDGRDPEQGRLEPRGERTLRRGDANGMMGDGFHTIRVLDEGPAMHLHLYGYPLDRLTGRVYFDGVEGGVERP